MGDTDGNGIGGSYYFSLLYDNYPGPNSPHGDGDMGTKKSTWVLETMTNGDKRRKRYGERGASMALCVLPKPDATKRRR